MKSLFSSSFFTFLLSGILFFTALPAHAGKDVVTFSDNLLSIDAENSLLPEILVEIGNITGVEIFLSTTVRAANLTLKIKDLPLEESFKRLLKNYSYAAVFTGSENHWQISTIKIFPKGSHTGELLPLALNKTKLGNRSSQTKTVYITDGREMPFGSGMAKQGAVAPTPAMSSLPKGATIETAPWVILQEQFSRELTDSFQKQLLLKKRIAATTDTEKREALAVSYADEIVRYQNMQRAQTNQLESIKRIYKARAASHKASNAGQR